MVKDAVAVPMQSVTIRTGDSNLSPEEIEKRKQKVAARDKGDNNAEVTERPPGKSDAERRTRKAFESRVRQKWEQGEDGQGDHRNRRRHFHGNQEWHQAQGDEVISGSYSAISRKLKDGAKVMIDKEATK